MKYFLLMLFISLFPSLMGQSTYKLYLIPGQACDWRTFQEIDLDSRIEIEVIEHLLPEKGERMPAYAKRMAAAIDTTQPYSILGVSFGGMVAVEMCKFLHPDELILVSSVKGRHEMPIRYRFLKFFPIYKLFDGRFYEWGTNTLRPHFEPEGRPFTDLSSKMLAAKDHRYMKRVIHLMMTWENREAPKRVLHLHGDKDRTLPIKRIQGARIAEGATHMLILPRAKWVSEQVNAYLANYID